MKKIHQMRSRKMARRVRQTQRTYARVKWGKRTASAAVANAALGAKQTSFSDFVAQLYRRA